MTDTQIQACQVAINMLAHVAPVAVVFAVGTTLVKLFIKFITGRGL